MRIAIVLLGAAGAVTLPVTMRKRVDSPEPSTTPLLRDKVPGLDAKVVREIVNQGRAEREQKRAAALRGTITGEFVLSPGNSCQPMRLRYVPPGRTTYGYTATELVRLAKKTNNPFAGANAAPSQPVTILEGYFILENEVAVGQYAAIMAHAQPPAELAPLPVRNVSWRDATAFCETVSRLSQWPVRLPTEIEWEYAAKGPTDQRYPWPNADAFHAWAGPVAGKSPRSVELPTDDVSWCGARHMGGNVREWCLDVYRDGALRDMEANPKLRAVTPRDVLINKLAEPERRAVRGGSYPDTPDLCETSARSGLSEDLKDPTVGFRVVLIVPSSLVGQR